MHRPNYITKKVFVFSVSVLIACSCSGEQLLIEEPHNKDYPAIIEKGAPSTNTDSIEVVCRKRFYQAMEEKCRSYHIDEVIIEGPSGFGKGGEVEDEKLGHGMSMMSLSGLCKVMAIALDYDELANIWSYQSYVVRPRGQESSILIERGLNAHYGDYIEKYYDVLGWKGGSNVPLTNIMVTASCNDLNGSVLIAVVSRYYESETEDNNRAVGIKLLLDIGRELFKDRNADISDLQQKMLGQHITNAMVVICPLYPRYFYNWDVSEESYYHLYSYNGGSNAINTMSLIKVLVAEVVLDNIFDLDTYVEITQGDINSAQGGSYPLFTAGQEVSYRDLLCALLMRSCNQAGYVLARTVGAKLLANS